MISAGKEVANMAEDAGYDVYNGSNPLVKNKVLAIICGILSSILEVDPKSLSEDTEVDQVAWVKLKERLALTHEFIVRDPIKSPMKVGDILKNISFVTHTISSA